ncbi:uncharacterized protein LOC114324226 isoform X5 [Diabrotica virgifera virgifera]|uniref:Uncharacterized protein n=1 Tax=Diabrotica virgifera virgifera TaxID=50390 RepID=A0ABM5I968_DIAVI|nr:uncharacterized protein LOC114324226 isoform X5 [Diabrotica virgifera virgifera]
MVKVLEECSVARVFWKNTDWIRIRSRFIQIYYHVIISTVLLACLPFGLMLGWPSPTNPILINKDSPIPITMDQSAMIAGFLMIGNTVGTPFCRKTFLGTKFSILIGRVF